MNLTRRFYAASALLFAVFAAIVWLSSSPHAQGVPPTVKVTTVNPATFYARNVALTTSPAQLPALTLASGIICTPRTTNTGSTWVGGLDMTTSTNQLPLANGQPFALGVTSLSAVYAYSTVSGDILDCYGN